MQIHDRTFVTRQGTIVLAIAKRSPKHYNLLENYPAP